MKGFKMQRYRELRRTDNPLSEVQRHLHHLQLRNESRKGHCNGSAMTEN